MPKAKFSSVMCFFFVFCFEKSYAYIQICIIRSWSWCYVVFCLLNKSDGFFCLFCCDGWCRKCTSSTGSLYWLCMNVMFFAGLPAVAAIFFLAFFLVHWLSIAIDFFFVSVGCLHGVFACISAPICIILTMVCVCGFDFYFLFYIRFAISWWFAFSISLSHSFHFRGLNCSNVVVDWVCECPFSVMFLVIITIYYLSFFSLLYFFYYYL